MRVRVCTNYKVPGMDNDPSFPLCWDIWECNYNTRPSGDLTRPLHYPSLPGADIHTATPPVPYAYHHIMIITGTHDTVTSPRSVGEHREATNHRRHMYTKDARAIEMGAMFSLFFFSRVHILLFPLRDLTRAYFSACILLRSYDPIRKP